MMKDTEMQMRVKKTQELVEIVPKSYNGKLSYFDVNKEAFYDWNELEPIRVKTNVEKTSSSTIKIGVTPVIKASIKTRQV